MAEKVVKQGGAMLFEDIASSTTFQVKVVTKAEKVAEYDRNLAADTKEILATECEINGVRATPSQAIAAGMVNHVLENPTPQNVKTMQDVVGDSVVKVDVGGMGIEKFLETVKPDGK